MLPTENKLSYAKLKNEIMELKAMVEVKRIELSEQNEF